MISDCRVFFVNKNGRKLSQEAVAANQDHSSVALWIKQYLKAPHQNQIPESVQELLTGFPGYIDGTGKPEEQINVHPVYIRIAQLSSSLLHKRIAIEERLTKAFMLAQTGAFASILIGMVTTILVALSSTEIGKQRNRTASVIRIGALVFPALGTAVAAIIAFYDPSGTLARQSQVASGMQQLHAQMANEVWSLKPIEKADDLAIPEDVAAGLDTWTQRYQQLLASLGDSRVVGETQQKASPTSSSP